MPNAEFHKALRKILIAPFVLLIRFYQHFISPCFPPSCRFTPTCSNYALEAFRKHGVLKGFLLSAWRILRCNPWCKGGEDPVPEKGHWKPEKIERP